MTERIEVLFRTMNQALVCVIMFEFLLIMTLIVAKSKMIILGGL